VAGAEAYLRAKFNIDPSNRLATIHQRYRQDRQTGQRSDSIGRTVLQTVAQKRLALTSRIFVDTCYMWPWFDPLRTIMKYVRYVLPICDVMFAHNGLYGTWLRRRIVKVTHQRAAPGRSHDVYDWRCCIEYRLLRVGLTITGERHIAQNSLVVFRCRAYYYGTTYFAEESSTFRGGFWQQCEVAYFWNKMLQYSRCPHVRTDELKCLSAQKLDCVTSTLCTSTICWRIVLLEDKHISSNAADRW